MWTQEREAVRAWLVLVEDRQEMVPRGSKNRGSKNRIGQGRWLEADGIEEPRDRESGLMRVFVLVQTVDRCVLYHSCTTDRTRV